jgi:hypothetical protein
VYLLSGQYYVIDGNRRVAAAKRNGLEFMDAHVIECVPHGNKEAHRGAVSQRLFRQFPLRQMYTLLRGGVPAQLRQPRNG